MKKRQLYRLLDIKDVVDSEIESQSNTGRPAPIDEWSLLIQDTPEYYSHSRIHRSAKLTIVISNPLIGLGIYPLGITREVIADLFDHFDVWIWHGGPNNPIIRMNNPAEFWKLAETKTPAGTAYIVHEDEAEIKKRLQNQFNPAQLTVLDIKRSRHLYESLDDEDEVTHVGKQQAEYCHANLKKIDLDVTGLSAEDVQNNFHGKKIEGICKLRCTSSQAEYPWLSIFPDLDHLVYYCQTKTNPCELQIKHQIPNLTLELDLENKSDIIFPPCTLQSLSLTHYGESIEINRIDLSAASITNLTIQHLYSHVSNCNSIYLPQKLTQLALVNMKGNHFELPKNPMPLVSFWMNLPNDLTHLSSLFTRLSCLTVPLESFYQINTLNKETLEELILFSGGGYHVANYYSMKFDGYSKLNYLKAHGVALNFDDLPEKLEWLFLQQAHIKGFTSAAMAQRIKLQGLTLTDCIMNNSSVSPQELFLPSTLRQIRVKIKSPKAYTVAQNEKSRELYLYPDLFASFLYKLTPPGILCASFTWLGEDFNLQDFNKGVIKAGLYLSTDYLNDKQGTKIALPFYNLRDLTLHIGFDESHVFQRFQDDIALEDDEKCITSIKTPPDDYTLQTQLNRLWEPLVQLDKLKLRFNNDFGGGTFIELYSKTITRLTISNESDKAKEHFEFHVKFNQLVSLEAKNILIDLQSLELKSLRTIIFEGVLFYFWYDHFDPLPTRLREFTSNIPLEESTEELLFFLSSLPPDSLYLLNIPVDDDQKNLETRFPCLKIKDCRLLHPDPNSIKHSELPLDGARPQDASNCRHDRCTFDHGADVMATDGYTGEGAGGGKLLRANNLIIYDAQGKRADLFDLRIHFYNYTYDDNGIKFTYLPNLANRRSLNIAELPGSGSNDYKAYLSLSVEAGEEYELPMHFGFELTAIALRPTIPFELLYYPSEQRYAIKLIADDRVLQDTLLIDYSCRYNANLNRVNSGQNQLIENPYPVNPLLVEKVKRVLFPDLAYRETMANCDSFFEQSNSGMSDFMGPNQNDPLYFLINPDYNLMKKLYLLKDYCKFHQNQFSTTFYFDDPIFLSIKEQIGVCRHSAMAFKLLADCFLNVSTRIVKSGIHVWVEVMVLDENGQEVVITFDLSGGEGVFEYLGDFTPLIERAQAARMAESQAAEQVKPMEIEQQPENHSALSLSVGQTAATIENDDELLFAEAEKQYSIDEIIQDSDSGDRRLCVLLPDRFDVQDWFATVNAKVREQGHDCLAANNYTQLVRLIRRTKRVQSELMHEDGVLLKKLAEKPTYLLVDWSKITQRCSFQSVFEGQDQIMGIQLPANFRLISCLEKGTELSPDFESRIKKINLFPESINSMINRAKITAKSSQAFELDLQHAPDWRSRSSCRLEFKDDEIIIHDGPLLQAIKEQKSLVFVNPPKTQEFSNLLYQLGHEKWLEYQGEIFELPESMAIETRELALSVYKPSSVVFNRCYENKAFIAINVDNWMDLFSLHRLPEQFGRPKTIPGLLSVYNPDEQVLCITEAIPGYLWNRLTKYIEENNYNRTLYIYLCPGVEIEGLQIEEAVDKRRILDAAHTGIMISSDPIATADELKAKYPNAKVIYTSRMTTYDGLINTLCTKPNLIFALQPTALLNELEVGNSTIILAGELSEKVYQAVLPFVLNMNLAWINGELKPVNGRMLLVLPPNCINCLQPFAYSDDSQTVLERIQQLQEVDRFILFVNRLQAEGWRSDELNTLGLTRLKLGYMQHAINRQQPLHRHNLLKGFFPDLVDESARAFLHVISKYCFGQSQQAEINSKKWSALLRRYKAQTASVDLIQRLIDLHFWEVFNCFNDVYINAIVSMHGFNKDALRKAMLDILHQHSFNNVAGLTSIEKFKQGIRRWLLEPASPALVVSNKNPDGQSYRLVQQVIQDQVYQTPAEIQTWLINGGSLILNHAENLPRGLFSFLRGVNQDTSTVRFQHRDYPYQLKTHRLILLCEEQPIDEPFFIECGEVLVYKLPTQDEILNLLRSNTSCEEEAQIICRAAYRTQELDSFIPVTEIEIKAFMSRYHYLLGQISEHPKLALFQAITSTFAFRIKSMDTRTSFLQELQLELGIEVELPGEETIEIIHNKFYASYQKILLARAIAEDIAMRKQYLDGILPPMAIYKNLVIVEGESGLGKSTLFEQILLDAGFSMHHADPRFRYYKMSAGTVEIYDLLEKAAREGSVVILDEVNLDPTLIQHLQQLLKDYPSFMVLASQNGVHYNGRHGLPKQFIAQSNYRLMDGYTSKELEHIAMHSLHCSTTRANHIVQDYNRVKQSQVVNPRTFFQAIAPKKRQRDSELEEIVESTPEIKRPKSDL